MRRSTSVLVCVAAASCTSAPPTEKPLPRPAAVTAAVGQAPCAAPSAPREPFQRKRTALAVALGGPYHGVIDTVVAQGTAAPLRAKFSYGKVSRDLEREPVAVLEAEESGGCPSWRPIGKVTTDANGEAAYSLEGQPLSGRHRYAFVVLGDGTTAEGATWVVSKGAPLVVFDVDGTLTQGDEALIEQLLSGASPPARDGAKEVADQHVANGAMVVYLTGRPAFLAGLTRAWLKEHGFPLGPVITTRTREQAMPTAEGVQRFKREALLSLMETGAVIDRVYGNAITDVCAYSEAGVDPAATFIVGSHAGKACGDGKATQAVRSYRDLAANR